MTEQQPEILTEETKLPQDHTTGDILPGISLPPKETPASYLLDFLEILVAAVSVTLLLFTLFFRICRVDGNSMRNTLKNQEVLITSNLSEVEVGDIVVFHQTSDQYDRFNEPLVKRVIATEGQTVRINYYTG
jgi:signal peptidase I